jgi:hypothetical protein
LTDSTLPDKERRGKIIDYLKLGVAEDVGTLAIGCRRKVGDGPDSPRVIFTPGGIEQQRYGSKSL